MPNQPTTTRTQSPEAVSGVQLAQGIGHRPTRGFWAEAWEQVIRRPGAIFGLTWISIVAFFAVFSPLIASGHPLVLQELGPDGNVVSTAYPLLENLKATDILLLIGTVAGLVWMFGPFRIDRSTRLGVLMATALQGGLVIVIVSLVRATTTGRDVSDAVRNLEQSAAFVPVVSAVVALITAAAVVFLVPFERWAGRLLTVGLTGGVAGVVVAMTWTTPIERFDYRQREARGEARAVYTLIPLSPQQGDTTLNIKPPGSNMLEPAIERFGRSTLVRSGLRDLAEADETGWTSVSRRCQSTRSWCPSPPPRSDRRPASSASPETSWSASSSRASRRAKSPRPRTSSPGCGRCPSSGSRWVPTRWVRTCSAR